MYHLGKVLQNHILYYFPDSRWYFILAFITLSFFVIYRYMRRYRLYILPEILAYFYYTSHISYTEYKMWSKMLCIKKIVNKNVYFYIYYMEFVLITMSLLFSLFIYTYFYVLRFEVHSLITC